MKLAALEVGEVNLLVELELDLNGCNGSRLSREEEMEVETRINVAGSELEFLFTKIVHLLKLCAVGFKFAADLAHDSFDGVFLALRVDDDGSFVFAAHGCDVG